MILRVGLILAEFCPNYPGDVGYAKLNATNTHGNTIIIGSIKGVLYSLPFSSSVLKTSAMLAVHTRSCSFPSINQFLDVAKSLGRVHEPQNLHKPVRLQLLLRVMFYHIEHQSLSRSSAVCVSMLPSTGQFADHISDQEGDATPLRDARVSPFSSTRRMTDYC